jgi:hypothetical protein
VPVLFSDGLAKKKEPAPIAAPRHRLLPLNREECESESQATALGALWKEE